VRASCAADPAAVTGAAGSVGRRTGAALVALALLLLAIAAAPAATRAASTGGASEALPPGLRVYRDLPETRAAAVRRLESAWEARGEPADAQAERRARLETASAAAEAEAAEAMTAAARLERALAEHRRRLERQRQGLAEPLATLRQEVRHQRMAGRDTGTAEAEARRVARLRAIVRSMVDATAALEDEIAGLETQVRDHRQAAAEARGRARRAAAGALRAADAAARAEAEGRALLLALTEARRRHAASLRQREHLAEAERRLHQSRRLALASPAPPRNVEMAPPPTRKWSITPPLSLTGRARLEPPGVTPAKRSLADASRLVARAPGRDARPEETPSTRGFASTLPVPGVIVARFGDAAAAPFDQGLTIEAVPAGRVRAPQAGRIAFAGGIKRFRQLLIIDHGNEYHTLLAGLSRLDVKEGDIVRAGQGLGRLAQDHDKPRLYLELRHRGRPVNPLPWLAAREDKVRG